MSEDLFLSYADEDVIYDSPLGNSDHKILFALPLTNETPINVRSYHTSLDYLKSNQTTLLELAADIDWMNFISKHNNVNDQLNEI